MEFKFVFNSKRRRGIAWTYSRGDVNLCIKGIMMMAEAQNITFAKMYGECVAHEIIHNLLEAMIGTETNNKIDRNTQRDKEVNEYLRSRGWIVIRIWEHELRKMK